MIRLQYCSPFTLWQTITKLAARYTCHQNTHLKRNFIVAHQSAWQWHERKVHVCKFKPVLPVNQSTPRPSKEKKKKTHVRHKNPNRVSQEFNLWNPKSMIKMLISPSAPSVWVGAEDTTNRWLHSTGITLFKKKNVQQMTATWNVVERQMASQANYGRYAGEVRQFSEYMLLISR